MRDLAELAIKMTKRDGTRITSTGHSLGGLLTHVTSHEEGIPGKTFNVHPRQSTEHHHWSHKIIPLQMLVAWHTTNH